MTTVLVSVHVRCWSICWSMSGNKQL